MRVREKEILSHHDIIPREVRAPAGDKRYRGLKRKIRERRGKEKKKELMQMETPKLRR